MTYLFSAFTYVSTFTHFLISTSSLCTLHVYISLITAFGWYTVRIWVFVCVCCAAPDKLTSPPPFTGLGALHYGIRALGSKLATWGHALGLPEGRIRVSTPSTVIR